MSCDLPKVVVVLGPTAIGKTAWGIEFVKAFNGEIISADSRQVYKKMDIGTAKPKGEWRGKGGERAYYVDNVPHHLMDFLDPDNIFTAAEFRDAAIQCIQDIVKRGRTPFIVGGTGLYISALVDNWVIPRVAPDKKLRESLEKKSLDELAHLLAELDPSGIKTIDLKNQRRLIRALEVSIVSGVPFSDQRIKGQSLVLPLLIGVDVPREELYRRIDDRVNAMIDGGLADETKRLLGQGYGWELPSMSGIGYRQLKGYLDGTASLESVTLMLKRDTRQFAKRQLTWWRRDARILWCRAIPEAKKHIQEFLDA